jgi:hypothetical protein
MVVFYWLALERPGLETSARHWMELSACLRGGDVEGVLQLAVHPVHPIGGGCG